VNFGLERDSLYMSQPDTCYTYRNFTPEALDEDMNLPSINTYNS